ncbi:MAG: 50S ribosomal protein L13 [Planctomycetota bacterium]
MNRQTTLLNDQTRQQAWHVVDATDQPLGRLASSLAVVLMGKHKPDYTPHVDSGDFVVVLNADKVSLSGRKAEHKVYKTYSGHPSGQKETPYGVILDKKPERLVEIAVRRMLPKNKLASTMLSKLKVYRGEDHPHAAQQPAPLDLATV